MAQYFHSTIDILASVEQKTYNAEKTHTVYPCSHMHLSIHKYIHAHAFETKIELIGNHNRKTRGQSHLGWFKEKQSTKCKHLNWSVLPTDSLTCQLKVSFQKQSRRAEQEDQQTKGCNLIWWFSLVSAFSKFHVSSVWFVKTLDFFWNEWIQFSLAGFNSVA